MDPDRLNSSDTSAVKLEVFGHHLHLAQDPNSNHHGTTVWDASIVFVKYLEKNCRRGRFCPSKLKGKRAIELGAGCGLAGIGMAMLGCDVVSTDQVEVLPLLIRNIERNVSRITQGTSDSTSVGSISVAELDWGNEDHIKAVGPPFDFVIGTDVVYAEHLLDPLLQTISALSGPRTTILMGYEIRSTSVHEKMIHIMKANYFKKKAIARSKMHPTFQHPSITLFELEQLATENKDKKSLEKSEENCSVSVTAESRSGKGQDDERMMDCEENQVNDGKEVEEKSENFDEVTDDWEARRYGSMAARLLKDVKIV